MNIISLMVVLVVRRACCCGWSNNYIPMEARIKQILNTVVVINGDCMGYLTRSALWALLPAPLVSVLVTLVVVGLLLWLVNSYIPMEGRIKADIEYRGDYPGGSLAPE